MFDFFTYSYSFLRSWIVNKTCLYLHRHFLLTRDFPDSSVGKESACNAGNPGWIPESGRSAGEGIRYPVQYSWASLVAQLVKNPPAMKETWFQSLVWEDPLEKGKATHTSILAWRIPWTVQFTRSQSQTHWATLTFTHFTYRSVLVTTAL